MTNINDYDFDKNFKTATRWTVGAFTAAVLASLVLGAATIGGLIWLVIWIVNKIAG